MTCRRCLQLIDTNAIQRHRRGSPVWEHLASCPECYAALAASMRLAAELPHLALPTPPPHLTEAIMATIGQAATRSGSDEVNKVQAIPGLPVAMWLNAFGGLVAAFSVDAIRHTDGAANCSGTSLFCIGGAPWSLSLLISLLLCAVSLLAITSAPKVSLRQ
jgi:hypothetical protein